MEFSWIFSGVSASGYLSDITSTNSWSQLIILNFYSIFFSSKIAQDSFKSAKFNEYFISTTLKIIISKLPTLVIIDTSIIDSPLAFLSCFF